MAAARRAPVYAESQNSKVKTQKSKIEINPQPLASDTQAEVKQEAEGYFLNAIEIARQQQAKSLELRAVMSLVRLRQLQASAHGSRITRHARQSTQNVAEVYGWFTEGFDTKDLQEAKELRMLNLQDVDLKQTRFYQEVFAEGRQEGEQEGRQKGRQGGRQEGEGNADPPPTPTPLRNAAMSPLVLRRA